MIVIYYHGLSDIKHFLINILTYILFVFIL